MSEKSITKGKHLTIYERTYIEDTLNAGHTLREMASHLGKDPTTISKEIKRNRVFKESKFELKGGCIKRRTCQKTNLCNKDCNRLCKKCTTRNCYRFCPDFTAKACGQVKKFPHVCNSCETKTTCKLNKYKYSAKVADANYQDQLRTSRSGINITRSELVALDNLVSPLVKKGQPINHIYANHKEEIKCSERTLYNYIDIGLLTVRNIVLRRKVKYKLRKKKSKDRKKVTHRMGRSYEDYTAYITENPHQEVIQIDTVIGKKGGKTLLTLFFINNSLMVGILLDKCIQDCVTEAFDLMYDEIGPELFKSMLPV